MKPKSSVWRHLNKLIDKKMKLHIPVATAPQNIKVPVQLV